MPSVSLTAVPTLTGSLVTLEPLRRDHADELAVAVQDGDLHELWYARVPSPETMHDDVAARLAQHAAGRVVPWVLRRNADGAALGVTTFLNIREDNRHLEIGSTWIAASAQGTGVNTEAKLLQLTHAFETLGCIAVELRTHWHNHRSRRAIAALGAKQDGVLRNHDLWRDGTVRDVVVFSIIDREWPTVRLGLTERLRARGAR
ncbi:GNAT family protein [Georgenia phoenicis]|uniref:GNAT family N-acetyltransferase n=1 Tax=unclassified Georgenia TaxID=2626815 RepID=UPI0039B1154F